jgi:DNA-binding NarL/FixJ family response regulator
MVKKFPEIKLIGEAADGRELITLVTSTKPDVILTDIQMPGMSGIEATREILKKNNNIAIIALSMFNEENYIVDMLEAGAKGYLLKNTHKDEIVQAIQTVNNGNNYYCKETSDKLLQMIAQSKFNPYKRAIRPNFNDREIEIIRLICDQLSNKEIAERLILSIRTIEGYREKILEKMEVHNTAGIVVYAIKTGIYKIK